MGDIVLKKPALKILKFLIENKSQDFNMNEISKNINMDYKLVHTNIKNISHLVFLKKVGNSNQCRFNFKYDYFVQRVEDFRKNEILQNQTLKIILQEIESLVYPFLTLVLFGSYAKKNYDKNSDIDLCLICDNKLIVKKIKQKLNLLPLDIDLHVFSVIEFRSMLDVKKDNLAKQIMSNNVILKGVEIYYGVIKNE